jgi:hypothetical protein
MNYNSRRNPKVSKVNTLIVLDIDKTTKNEWEGIEEEGAESLAGNIRSVLKNIKLTVNKVHIRFEEDYFSNGESRSWEPFSFGVVIDRVEIETSQT